MSGKLFRILPCFALAMALVLTVFGTGAAAPDPGLVLLTYEGKPLAARGELTCGTTMVPVSVFASELGFTVSTRSFDTHLVVSEGGKKVELGPDSSSYVVNGHEILNAPGSFMEDGQLMVPLRFLLESMGHRVIWQGGTQNSVDIRPVAENNLVIGTVRERQETATLSVDIQYPKVAGLAPAIQEPMNSYFADRTNGAKAEADRAEKTNVEAGLTRWPTQLFLNYTVAYNQKGLLSLTFDDYLYAGGAHGSTTRTGYTVDVNSGKSYTLKDLFLPETDYIAVLSAEVARQIEEKGLAPLAPFTEIRADQDFYINDDSLVVYFQQYELMAYAYGFPEFRIPMSSLADVLVPELATMGWTTGI